MLQFLVLFASVGYWLANTKFVIIVAVSVCVLFVNFALCCFVLEVGWCLDCLLDCYLYCAFVVFIDCRCLLICFVVIVTCGIIV